MHMRTPVAKGGGVPGKQLGKQAGFLWEPEHRDQKRWQSLSLMILSPSLPIRNTLDNICLKGLNMPIILMNNHHPTNSLTRFFLLDYDLNHLC